MLVTASYVTSSNWVIIFIKPRENFVLNCSLNGYLDALTYGGDIQKNIFTKITGISSIIYDYISEYENFTCLSRKQQKISSHGLPVLWIFSDFTMTNLLRNGFWWNSLTITNQKQFLCINSDPQKVKEEQNIFFIFRTLEDI